MTDINVHPAALSVPHDGTGTITDGCLGCFDRKPYHADCGTPCASHKPVYAGTTQRDCETCQHEEAEMEDDPCASCIAYFLHFRPGKYINWSAKR